MQDRQTSLLGAQAQQQVNQSRFESLPPALQLGTAELADWKSRINRFQRQVAIAPPPQQGSLFAVAEAPGQYGPTTDVQSTAETLNPFTLPQQNTEFWRWQFDDVGVAALYFVIDYSADLLLYVGETVKSNQRWKGEHDCKRYLLNYRQVHYQQDLPSQLGIAFWPHAPAERKPRQQLESALIQRWRPPFNKENWQFWGTPFVSKA
ncbi:MAG: GIY-YIG nuclease family protein [Cyanobacteria bacterium J06632_22]